MKRVREGKREVGKEGENEAGQKRVGCKMIDVPLDLGGGTNYGLSF